MNGPEILVQLLVVALGSGGAAWATLNGTRERVKEIVDDVKGIRTTQGEHSERLVKIETKLDIQA
jgi:hypothetical protein